MNSNSKQSPSTEIQCRSILKWIQTFNVFQKKCENFEDLNDGIILSDILVQVQKEFFTVPLKSLNLQINPPQEVKIQNLKILFSTLREYYSMQFDIQLESKIDYLSIANANLKQSSSLIALIELVLGVIVNSEDGATYIEKIMDLDQDTQEDLQNVVQRAMQIIDGGDHMEDMYQEQEENQELPIAGGMNEGTILTQEDYIEKKQMSMVSLGTEGMVKAQRLRSQEDEKLSGRGSSRGANLQDNIHQRVDTQGSNFSQKRQDSIGPHQISPDRGFDRIDLEFALQKETDRIEELHHQIQSLEKERTRIRNLLIKYEEENKVLINQLEETRIENIELKKQLEISQDKISVQQKSRGDELNTQFMAMKELEQEIDQKNKKMREMQKEKVNTEKRYEEQYNQLRDELDLANERIIQLSKNEAMIDVYKKKIENIAVLKSDLKEMQERNRNLVDQLDVYEKERENYKKAEELINYYKEELQMEKDRLVRIELDLQKKDNKIKDLQNDKFELEKKNQFNLDRIEQLEKEVAKAQKEVKEAIYGEIKEEGGLLPDIVKTDMREKIKKLEKENQLLKQELETRFDKEKMITEQKLFNEQREKKKLEESNQLMEERLKKLEERLFQTMNSQNNDSEGRVKGLQQHMEYLQQELKSVAQERDQYYLKITEQEIEVNLYRREKERQVQETNEAKLLNQKLLMEKSNLQEQVLCEKDNLMKITYTLNKQEGEVSDLKRQLEFKQNEIDRIKEQEAIYQKEISMLKEQKSSNNESSSLYTSAAIEQLMKINDNFQSTQFVNELKYQLKEKDDIVRDLERQLILLKSEQQNEIAKINKERTDKESSLINKIKNLEKQLNYIKENRISNRKIAQNMHLEQQLMSSTIHKLGYELYQQQQQQQQQRN